MSGEGGGAFYANTTRRNDGGSGEYPRYTLAWFEDADPTIGSPASDDPVFGIMSAITEDGDNAKFIAGILNAALPSDEWTTDLTNLSAGIVIKTDRVTVKPGIVLDPTSEATAPNTEGSMIYDSVSKELKYYDDVGWQVVSAGGLSSHALDGAYHSATGLTVGWVLSADSETTFSWKAQSGGGSHDLTGASHTEDATGGAGNVLRATGATAFAWATLAHGDLSDAPADAHHVEFVSTDADNLILTHKNISTAHHTPPVVGDFDHNDLANIDADDIKHITSAQLGALHTVVVAGDLDHNDLANIDADDINHLTDAQVTALHAAYTDGDAEAVITAEIVGGQSIDNAIDSLISDHAGDDNAHHEVFESGDFTTAFAAESLANLGTRTHTSLSDAPEDAHHAKVHALIDATNHPESGLTSGHFLKATGTTTYAFGAHGLTASDVGAASLPVAEGDVTFTGTGGHDHSSGDGGTKLDWDTCWSDAVHSHASDSEGSVLAFTTAFANPNAGDHDHSTNLLGDAVPEGSITFSATGHDHDGTGSENVDYTNLDSIPSTFTPAAHVLATSGPHSSALPLIDIASYAQGSLIIGGGADWQALAKGDADQVLTSDGTDLSWEDPSGITGSGTQYALTMWTDAGGTVLGDSVITQDSGGTKVTIASTTDTMELEVSSTDDFAGIYAFSTSTTSSHPMIAVGKDITADLGWMMGVRNTSSTVFDSLLFETSTSGSGVDGRMEFKPNGTLALTLDPDGRVTTGANQGFRVGSDEIEDSAGNTIFNFLSGTINSIAQIDTNLDVTGTMTIGTIATEASDVDKFLVDSSGVVKFRTGVEAYSDMGGYVTADFTTDFSGESLANLTTRTHASLSDAPADAHHVEFVSTDADTLISTHASDDNAHHEVIEQSDVEGIITTELTDGESIDLAIDALVLTHKNISTAHHTATVAGDLDHNDLSNIDADDIKHITAAQLGALHATYTDGDVESVIDAEIVDGQSIDAAIDALILTHKNLSTAHHTPPVAGDFNHNDLANIDAGDINHLSDTQISALHDIYTDASAIAAVVAENPLSLTNALKIGGNSIEDSAGSEMIGFSGDGYIDFLASQGSPPTTGDVLAWNNSNSRWEVSAQAGAGGITGSGTNDQITKWNSAGSTIEDSLIADDGTSLVVSGGVDISFTAGARINAIAGTNDHLVLNPKGTGSVLVNWDDGTGGLQVGDGDSNPVFIVDSAGNVTDITLAHATVDTDKFAVLDGSQLKYRTGSELLSDIGAGSFDGKGTGFVFQISGWNAPRTPQSAGSTTTAGRWELTSGGTIYFDLDRWLPVTVAGGTIKITEITFYFDTTATNAYINAHTWSKSYAPSATSTTIDSDFSDSGNGTTGDDSRTITTDYTRQVNYGMFLYLLIVVGSGSFYLHGVKVTYDIV